MSKKNTIDTLKATLKTLKSAFSTQKSQSFSIKYKFEIEETVEGQTLLIPVLEVGAPVTVASAEGETPASDGWYKVEGDIEIKVEGGIISEIIQPEVAEDFETEEDEKEKEEKLESEEVGADAVQAIEEAVQAVAEAVEQVQAIQEEIETLKTEFSKFSKMNEDVKALTNAVQKFSKEPVNVSVTDVNKEIKLSAKDEKIKALAGIMGKKN